MRPERLFAVCGVIILVGVVFLRNAPRPETDAIETVGASGPVIGTPVKPPAHAVVRSVTSDLTISLKALADEALAQIPQEAPVVAPPTTEPTPPTTVAPPVTPTTVAPVVAPTTTTIPPLLGIVPVPVVAEALAVLSNSESGIASWYGAPTGTCAHKTLPFGTMVRVTRTSTGAVVTCRVADPRTVGPGRVIDLSEDMFEGIASLGTGLTDVKLEW